MPMSVCKGAAPGGGMRRSMLGLSTAIIYCGGGVYASMPMARTCVEKATGGTNTTASLAGRRLKRTWASVSVEEDCVSGNISRIQR